MDATEYVADPAERLVGAPPRICTAYGRRRPVTVTARAIRLVEWVEIQHATPTVKVGPGHGHTPPRLVPMASSFSHHPVRWSQYGSRQPS